MTHTCFLEHLLRTALLQSVRESTCLFLITLLKKLLSHYKGHFMNYLTWQLNIINFVTRIFLLSRSVFFNNSPPPLFFYFSGSFEFSCFYLSAKWSVEIFKITCFCITYYKKKLKRSLKWISFFLEFCLIGYGKGRAVNHY